MELSDALAHDLVARLRRVEGQARGVQRMLEEGRDCGDVVQQITAMRAALGKVAAAIVAENLEKCLRGDPAEDGAERVRRAKRAILDLV